MKNFQKLANVGQTWDAMRTLRTGFLGRVGYREATKLQKDVRDRIFQGGDDHLLLLEHPPVFTLGRSASSEDVLLSENELRDSGLSVEQADRGGQVTYHGPGQLVGYPILDLNPDRRDIRAYVRDLQAVLVRTLQDFGIESVPRYGQPEIGVWVGDRKIASIGVHLSRWVTTHGFALNVTTDLDRFAGIVACGLEEVEMTSIGRETGQDRDLTEVAVSITRHFGKVFDRSVEPLEPAVLEKVSLDRLGS